MDAEERAVGDHVGDVPPDYPTVRNYYTAVADLGEGVEFEGRYYEIETFPLDDARGRYVGQTISVRDVLALTRGGGELVREPVAVDDLARTPSNTPRRT